MTIKEYKELAYAHEPCEEGRELFDSCTSRKGVFDLMVSPRAYDFVMKSVKEGWGPSPVDIENIFKYYVNGRHTSTYRINERNIKSQVWCRTKDVNIDDPIRTVLLFGCTGNIVIRQWQVVRIIMDKNCDIDIECPDNAIVIIDNYGGSVYDMYKNCKIYDR